MYDELRSILIGEIRLIEEDVRPEASLEEAGLDSLAIVDLSLVLSKRYGIEISDDELIENTRTVADIADLLRQRVSSGLTQTSG